jgi:hypothetical protein
LCSSSPAQPLSPPTPEASLPEIKFQFQSQEEPVPQAAMSGFQDKWVFDWGVDYYG